MFARKLIRPFATLTPEDVSNEIRAVTKLCTHGHRNIIYVRSHYLLQNSPYYAIDMELCELTLADYIRGNREQVATVSVLYDSEGNANRDERCIKWHSISTIMQHIFRGLSFIHSCNEIHRDLKPSNSEFQFTSGLIPQFFIQLVQMNGK
jgi:serine/threonine protein kinase